MNDGVSNGIVTTRESYENRMENISSQMLICRNRHTQFSKYEMVDEKTVKTKNKMRISI